MAKIQQDGQNWQKLPSTTKICPKRAKMANNGQHIPKLDKTGKISQNWPTRPKMAFSYLRGSHGLIVKDKIKGPGGPPTRSRSYIVQYFLIHWMVVLKSLQIRCKVDAFPPNVTYYWCSPHHSLHHNYAIIIIFFTNHHVKQSS